MKRFILFLGSFFLVIVLVSMGLSHFVQREAKQEKVRFEKLLAQLTGKDFLHPPSLPPPINTGAAKKKIKRKFPLEDPSKYGIVMVENDAMPVNQAEWDFFMEQLYEKRRVLGSQKSEVALEASRVNTWDFSEDEFNDSMPTAVLVEAIRAKDKIDFPPGEKPIESLNKLLFRSDLYKFMPNRPFEHMDLISRLAKGERLNPQELKCINRLLIEANYPEKTPNSQKIQPERLKQFSKHLDEMIVALEEKRKLNSRDESLNQELQNLYAARALDKVMSSKSAFRKTP